MAGPMGFDVPVWDIRTTYGDTNILPVPLRSFSAMMKDGDSRFASAVFSLRLLEFLQALNGSRSAFTTCQDRKRYLSTIRTIRVATE